MSRKKTTPARKRRASAPRVDIDLAAEQRRCEQTARRALAFINAPDLPGYLRDAVIDAITRAGIRADFTTPDAYAQAGRAEAKQLAELFAVTGGNFTLGRAPADEFAYHLSEVLALAKYHPDLIPTDAFNEIADAANTLLNGGLDFDSEGVFRLALAGYARKVAHREEARRLVEGEGGARGSSRTQKRAASVPVKVHAPRTGINPTSKEGN